MAVEFWSPVQKSIEIACVSGLIVLIIGLIMGRMMSKKNFKGKVIFETILMLPLVLPPSVVGFLLIVIFGKNSPVGKGIETIFNQSIIFTWWAAVIAAVVVSFPLMYQSVKTGFSSIDFGIEEAARIDGANEWKVFIFVSIPLAFKSIVSGAVLSFARALGEFGATLMFAGNIPGKTQTTSTAIYVAIDSGNLETAWLWVLMMVIVSFIMLIAVQYIR
ncbi:molybdate ABC transporter permease subunit [Cytobacillus sp. IB215665]|uniref:molybdate ABC transporter permease subunit n=1 Tax=Cytobacillus sp. IB215665 TaxID=3097357 RepID=UPI002A1773DC|nr:molybdate ABC transporter permease subunit [Cytobacillus sp. IB215665]MDX8363532.1 molybdate ABC transporter permease subunit [Cytobacillus sp. IB215665]